MDGVPHLRIENRVLPSGPTTVDEMANAALWLGLMRGIGAQHPEVSRMIEFDTTRSNFVNAAREGLSSSLFWIDGQERPAPELLLDVLLPIAADGLDAAGVSTADSDRYLGIDRTPSQVRLHGIALAGLVDAVDAPTGFARAATEQPHGGDRRSPAGREPGVGMDRRRASKRAAAGSTTSSAIEQIMVTELVTVAEDDPLDLAANLMDWHRLRQVLVEDDQDGIIGILSYRRLLRVMADDGDKDGAGNELCVGDVMQRDPVCVPPSMAPLRALEIMRSFGIGALPVVDDGVLVGLVTEHDFMNVAGILMLQQLEPPGADDGP